MGHENLSTDFVFDSTAGYASVRFFMAIRILVTENHKRKQKPRLDTDCAMRTTVPKLRLHELRDSLFYSQLFYAATTYIHTYFFKQTLK